MSQTIQTFSIVGRSADGTQLGVAVVGKGQSYGGLSDVAVDLRCDDHPEPISELGRMLHLQ